MAMSFRERWGGAATVVMVAVATVAIALTGQAVVSRAHPTPSVPTAAGTHLASFDSQMITLVNGARKAAGVAPVQEAKGLDQLAVWWSAQMDAGVTSYALQHNPNAWTSLLTYGAANRTAWGENVAWSSSTSTTPQQLFTAYMNSAGHRANILSSAYHYVGMGTVAGTHGLFNTTEFTDAVQAGQAIVPAVPTDFVVDTTTHAVYRLVGGAPIYVTNWAAVGGTHPTRAMTHAQILALRPYPTDGTFVVTSGNGAVYRIAGGAPVYVSSWTPFGGSKPAVLIDAAAVARAGSGSYFNHLRVLPLDGTFLSTSGGGGVFRVVGGAPVYLSSWAPFGGAKATVAVDPAALSRAGAGSYYNHLRSVPADGTFVVGAAGAVFRVAGGAPIYVSSWKPFGGSKPSLAIDPAAIVHAGGAGAWSHLRQVPVDNTYIQGAGQPSIYRVISGIPRHVTSWASVGGPKPFTPVDPAAISKAGTGGNWNHLLKAR